MYWTEVAQLKISGDSLGHVSRTKSPSEFWHARSGRGSHEVTRSQRLASHSLRLKYGIYCSNCTLRITFCSRPLFRFSS